LQESHRRKQLEKWMRKRQNETVKERLEKGPWMRQRQGEEGRKVGEEEAGKGGRAQGDPVLLGVVAVLVEERERGSCM